MNFALKIDDFHTNGQGWMRFYEYFAHPGDRNSVTENALYCANTIKNAAKEASLGVPFVAAASDYPWGSPGKAPPGPPAPHPHPAKPPCDSFKSKAACTPRCIFDSGTCDPLPPPPPGTEDCPAVACSNPGAQWQWTTPQTGGDILSTKLEGSTLRLGTWPNCQGSVIGNGRLRPEAGARRTSQPSPEVQDDCGWARPDDSGRSWHSGLVWC